MSAHINDSRTTSFLSVIALSGVIAFVIGPLVWMIQSSLRPAEELFATPPQWTMNGLTLAWYREVFAGTDAIRWFTNSTIVAACTTLLNAVIAPVTAYSLIRFRYPGRRLFMSAVLGSYLVPSILMVIPFYLLLNSLHLTTSLAGIILAHLAATLPFSIWLMRSFLLNVSEEIIDAARIDGCSELSAFTRIVLPLTRTGLISTSLFAFIMSWHEFMFASVLTTGGTQTVSVALAHYITGYEVRWGPIMALSTMVTLPIVLAFALLQQYFERGLLAGGVKG